MTVKPNKRSKKTATSVTGFLESWKGQLKEKTSIEKGGTHVKGGGGHIRGSGKSRMAKKGHPMCVNGKKAGGTRDGRGKKERVFQRAFGAARWRKGR